MITKDLRVGLPTYATQVPVAWEKIIPWLFYYSTGDGDDLCDALHAYSPSANLHGAAPGGLGLCFWLSSLYGADRAEPYLLIPFCSL